MDKMRERVEAEIQKLLPIRYEKVEAGNLGCYYTARIRDPAVDPDIDEVVERVIEIVLKEAI